MCIPKTDLFSKVPKDVQNLIEEKASSKLTWIKKRLIDICMGIE